MLTRGCFLTQCLKACTSLAFVQRLEKAAFEIGRMLDYARKQREVLQAEYSSLLKARYFFHRALLSCVSCALFMHFMLDLRGHPIPSFHRLWLAL